MYVKLGQGNFWDSRAWLTERCSIGRPSKFAAVLIPTHVRGRDPFAQGWLPNVFVAHARGLRPDHGRAAYDRSELQGCSRKGRERTAALLLDCDDDGVHGE
jgi:hypothetical protein